MRILKLIFSFLIVHIFIERLFDFEKKFFHFFQYFFFNYFNNFLFFIFHQLSSLFLIFFSSIFSIGIFLIFSCSLMLLYFLVIAFSILSILLVSYAFIAISYILIDAFPIGFMTSKVISISSIHTWRTSITDYVIIVAKFICLEGSHALWIPTSLLVSSCM